MCYVYIHTVNYVMNICCFANVCCTIIHILILHYIHILKCPISTDLNAHINFVQSRLRTYEI